MEKEELNKIYTRLYKILKGKKGIKKRLSGEWVKGFLVALVDYGVLTSEEYKDIRDSLISVFGYFA